MADALRFEGIEKSFAGVPVLRGVSFALRTGRTLGLVGENGAGKSTLMNILGGNLAPDAGRMFLDGRLHAPRHPQDAARAGVAFIHQELNLFTNLSIAENLFVNAFPCVAGLPLIRRAAVSKRTSALLAEVGLAAAPDTPIDQLSAGERQLVEIARALSIEARLIILDEPTTSLSVREVEGLFALMTRLRARGIAMIYISHILEHILRLCDDLLVLRDGAVVGGGAVANFTTARLVSLMVGRELAQLYPERRGVPSQDPILEVRRVSEPGIVRNISFTLHRGEVLGISGLMGAGRSELARIVFGLDPHTGGEVLLAGAQLGRASPHRRIARGLAFLTEDRRHEGLCLDASIADNLALVSLRDYARTPLRLLDRRRWREAVATIREAVRLSPQAIDAQPVSTLSGGNQQKVVLAKWLLARPVVLILDEPTRGVDVGAKFELHRIILDLADGGAGVLIISSEVEELIGICDRILVMSEGALRGEFLRGEFDRERLLQAALPRDATATSAADSAISAQESSGARPKSFVANLMLRHAPLLLFACVVAAFGVLAPKFFTAANALNVVVQAAPVGLVSVGMTFVLLTAGVDLSVGAIMFIGAAVAAKLVLSGQLPALALAAMLGSGVVLGGINALFITRARLAPFIVTLALLFIGRGFALWLTQTRAMNLPDWFLHLGTSRILGISVPLLVFAFVVTLSHVVLTRTPFGRQLYAVGDHPESARKAGLHVRRLVAAVYVISGFCAALGGILALAQLGAVSPKFGESYEFKAIAAAVLGGTSLFGGRGAVWPGTVVGVLLIQMIESGLVMLNANPYTYPLITAAVIFLITLLDSTRQAHLERSQRRPDARFSASSKSDRVTPR
jgi:ribose transport system ATP-binding protein